MALVQYILSKAGKSLIAALPVLLFSSLNLSAQARLSTPLEILSYMEASPTRYEIEYLTEPAPRLPRPILSESAFVKMIEEQAFLRSYEDYETRSQRQLRLAVLDDYNREKPNWKKMRQRCLKILAEKPDHAQVMTLLGLSYMREKKPEQAWTWFRKALETNPLDYQARRSMSELLQAKGKQEEALQALLTAHIYNRNQPVLLEELKGLLQKNGYTYDNQWQFEPDYIIFPDTVQQTIVIAAKDFWLSYALYKAVWNYEPGYRFIKESQEVTDYLFQEEMEAALGTFLSFSQLDYAQPPKVMTVLGQAIDNRMLEEYVMYEILLPRQPELAHLLTEEFLVRLRRYVLQLRCQKLQKKP